MDSYELAISLANHLASLKQLDTESFRDTIDQAQMMLPREVHIYHMERDICISLGDASIHKRMSIGSYPKGDEIPYQVSPLNAVCDSMVEVPDPNQ